LVTSGLAVTSFLIPQLLHIEDGQEQAAALPREEQPLPEMSA